MKAFGLLFSLVTILFFINVGGPIYAFIDIPSLLMVLFITTGLSMAKYKSEGLLFWKLSDESKKSEIASWIGKTCIQVGFFSSILGFILLATNYNNLPSSEIPAGMIVAILPIFYSMIIYFFITKPLVNIRDFSNTVN